jgi:two-component system response regulator HydG
LRYDWPGNVRELAHLVERALLLGRDAEVPATMLPSSMRTQPSSGGPTFEGEVLPMRELQRRYAAWALVQLGGNKRRTAEKLDMDHKTLAKLVAEEEESVPRS